MVAVVEMASCLPHPGPPAGTRETAASLPLCSDFSEGKFTGPLRAGTRPKLCMPCLSGTALFCCCFSEDSP